MLPHECVVVIPAAGSGSRFGGDTPKQYLPLRGKPVLLHTAEKFARDSSVQRVVICAAPDQFERAEALFEDDVTHKIEVVVGGETRQDSVMRGLEALGEHEVIVAVHDAVRPFFSYGLFHSLVELAAERGAAVPLLPLTDTLHRIGEGMVVETARREEWGLAQTPQCFRLPLLRDALHRARTERLDATDEAAILRRFGHQVHVIAGERHNFKITHPDDLVLAEANFDRWSTA